MGIINVTDLISAKLIAYANRVLFSPHTVVCVNIPDIENLNFSAKQVEALACENYLFRDESVDLLLVNSTADDFTFNDFFISTARILSKKGMAIFAVLDSREHEVAEILNTIFVLQYSSLHTRIHKTELKIYFATTMKAPHYLKRLLQFSADDAATVTDNLINFVPLEKDLTIEAEVEHNDSEAENDKFAGNETDKQGATASDEDDQLTEIEVNELPEHIGEAIEPLESPEKEDPEDAEDHLDPEELENPPESEEFTEQRHAAKAEDEGLLRIHDEDDEDDEGKENVEKYDEKEHFPEDPSEHDHAEHSDHFMHPEHEALHEAAEQSEHVEVREIAIKLKEHTKILMAHAKNFSNHFSSTAPILQQLKDVTMNDQSRQSKLNQLQSHYQQHQLLLKQYKNLVGNHEKLLTNFINAQQKALRTDVDQYQDLIQHHNKFLAEHNDQIKEHDDFELKL